MRRSELGRTLRRDAVVLVGYGRFHYLRWVVARSWVFTLAAQHIVPPLIGLAIWSTALPNRRDVTTYFAALLVVRMLTASYERHTLTEAIYSGELSAALLRPHPPVLDTLGENLALRIVHLLMALPVLAAVLLFVPLRFDAGRVGIAVPAVVLAGLLCFLYTYTLALLGFWTTRAGSIVDGGRVLMLLLGGDLAPVPLMPGWLRPWAEVLPFRSMVGFPAEAASGLGGDGGLLLGFAWQLVWLVVLTLVAARTWRAGVRRYTPVGG